MCAVRNGKIQFSENESRLFIISVQLLVCKMKLKCNNLCNNTKLDLDSFIFFVI